MVQCSPDAGVLISVPHSLVEAELVNHAVILAISNPNHRSRLTYNRAHALLPALGKPLFVRIMERLYRVGIREYTVIVGEGEGAVTSYLNSQWMPDVKINIDITFQAESLSKHLKQIAAQRREPFLICSYNSFTHTHFPERLVKIHNDSPESLIFSGAPNTLSQAKEHVYAVTDGQQVVDVVRKDSKEHNLMTLNGLFVAGHDMVDYLASLPEANDAQASNQHFFDLARQFVLAGGTNRIAESHWILQVEADRDLLTLNKHLLDEDHDTHILSELPYTVKIVPPVRIDPQVSVGQGARIGPHVYLERGCTVGHEAMLKESIVLTNASVPASRTLVNTVLTTRGPIT